VVRPFTRAEYTNKGCPSMLQRSPTQRTNSAITPSPPQPPGRSISAWPRKSLLSALNNATTPPPPASLGRKLPLHESPGRPPRRNLSTASLPGLGGPLGASSFTRLLQLLFCVVFLFAVQINVMRYLDSNLLLLPRRAAEPTKTLVELAALEDEVKMLRKQARMEHNPARQEKQLTEELKWFQRRYHTTMDDYLAKQKLYKRIINETLFLYWASPTTDPDSTRSVLGKYIDQSTIKFIGHCPKCDYAVGTLDDESYKQLWRKTRDVFKDALTRFPAHKYFLKLDTDTYVVPENVVAWLGTLDETKPLYSGWFYSYPGDDIIEPLPMYASGGAGYIVNRLALEMTRGFSIPKCHQYVDVQVLQGLVAKAGLAQHDTITAKGKEIVSYEDVFMGRCMQAAGVNFTKSNKFNHESWAVMVTEALRSPNYDKLLRDLEYPCTFHDPMVKDHSRLVALDDAFRNGVIEMYLGDPTAALAQDAMPGFPGL